jgi:hypothetical protein
LGQRFASSRRRALEGVRYVALAVVAAGSVVAATASGDPSPLLGIRAAGAADQPAPSVGQPAPVIELADQHGKTFVLADALKAKKFVVVAFYPKAFSGG